MNQSQADFIMLAKKDLKELAEMDSAIKHLHQKLEEKQSRVYGVSGTNTSDTKVQTSRKNKLEDNIVEIAELKEAKVIAEAKTVTAEINPMMADIHSEGKYTLLEKEEKPSSYSLLSK